MRLLLLVGAAFGLAFIAGYSKLSLPLRVLLDPGSKVDSVADVARAWLLMLLECPACIAWHVGFWLTLFGPDWAAVVAPGVFSAVVVGCFCCGAVFLLGRLSGLIALEPHD
jgi:hypothetical protein